MFGDVRLLCDCEEAFVLLMDEPTFTDVPECIVKVAFLDPVEQPER
jgi:hypothetical protein